MEFFDEVPRLLAHPVCLFLIFNLFYFLYKKRKKLFASQLLTFSYEMKIFNY
jgi:hypothetical protein